MDEVLGAIRAIRKGYGLSPPPKIREELHALNKIPVSITAQLGKENVSIWSGATTEGNEDVIMKAVRTFRDGLVAPATE